VTRRVVPTVFGQIVKFGVVGIVATLVHTVCFVSFVDFVGLSAIAANFASFAVAFAVSFMDHFKWTFRDPSRSSVPTLRPALFKFALTALIGLGLNTAIAYGIVDHLGLSHYVAAGLMLSVVPGMIFVLSRRWAFA
jgi:putative flippase GtrA